MNALKVAAGIVVAILLFCHFAAVMTVDGQLEDSRRKDAPPIPGWNWGRFQYLTDPANLRPGTEGLVRRYKLLWYSSLLVPVDFICGYCFLAG